MNFTIFTSKCIGNKQNTFYPTEHQISSEDEMDGVIPYDHVCARYKNNLRSSSNFLESDVVVMDCDNEHTENPDDWMTPQKLGELLGDVAFVTAPSRHNNLVKDGKGPRPRFHVYFPIPTIESDTEYADLKASIYEAYNFFDKNALDAGRFIFGSKKGQCYWHEGKQSIVEILEEDFQDFDEIIPEGQRNSTLSRYAGCVLKRYGNSDKAFELFSEKADNCDPPLGETELKAIWNSAVKFFNNKIVPQKGYVSPEQYNNDFKIPPMEWDEPVPFGEHSVEPFPIEALPGSIRDYVEALSESVQTPVDMAGCAALSVIATCIQGKYVVQGKEDWKEPLNLYISVIASPSERKSAIQHAMVKPISDYENEYNLVNASAVESNRSAKRVLERRLKAVEEQIVKGKATKEDADKITRELAEFHEVKPLSLFVDDITPEKLVSVLAQNGGRMAILSSEAGIFDTLSGAYSKSVNIDVMLKSYSGDQIRVDRINRDTDNVLNPTLTVLLMAQPELVSRVLGNKIFRGRGLTARFLYSNPSSTVGERRYRSKAVTPAVENAYVQCIKGMLEDPYSAKPEVITLSPEADAMLESFSQELEPKLKVEYEEISDWAGKLVGNVLRISGLLCRAQALRVDVIFGDYEPLVVDEKTMENAIKLGRYFLNHAKTVFDVMPENAMFQDAHKILKMLSEKGLTEFTRRTAMRNCQSFKRAEEIQPVLDFLRNDGYIEQVEPLDSSEKGRPEKYKYLVNPWVTENYSQVAKNSGALNLTQA